MSSISQAFETRKTRSAKIYRWVLAWLATSAVIAVLLLANSVRDYFFVAKIIATSQVRHQMSQRAISLELQLRQDPLTRAAAMKSLMQSGGRPLWIELRGPEGQVLEHIGEPGPSLFSLQDELDHARSHEGLFAVVPATIGDAVVEVFPIRASATPVAANAPMPSKPPVPLMLEIAMPLRDVDSSTFWPIRRNLFINCLGALALLVTVVVAGMGFRSYAHGKEIDEQLEIAREVQAGLLPPLTEEYLGLRLATEYTPAEQVGGDFYDVFRLEGERTALVMGDVAGKGVPAALLMGVIHGAVRSSLWSESPGLHESESQQLNRLLYERTSGERYASMFWCYHDPIAHSLSYVNAGHWPPLLIRTKQGDVEISRLEVGGPVLGVLRDARYAQATLEVARRSSGHVLRWFGRGHKFPGRGVRGRTPSQIAFYHCAEDRRRNSPDHSCFVSRILGRRSSAG